MFLTPEGVRRQNPTNTQHPSNPIRNFAAAAFRRSPGLESDGEVRIETIDDREFLNVARVKGFPKPAKNGAYMSATVDKHHVIGFKAGREVSLMKTPEGLFVELIGTPEHDAKRTLPDGATLITYTPDKPWIVDLPHPVKAYFWRGEHMRSFQGPITLPE